MTRLLPQPNLSEKPLERRLTTIARKSEWGLREEHSAGVFSVHGELRGGAIEDFGQAPQGFDLVGGVALDLRIGALGRGA